MADTVMLVGCGNMGRAMLRGWLKASSDITALVVEPDADLREAAANLFAALHKLNDTGRPIAVSPIPQHGLGTAINDRLRRAAAPRD